MGGVQEEFRRTPEGVQPDIPGGAQEELRAAGHHHYKFNISSAQSGSTEGAAMETSNGIRRHDPLRRPEAGGAGEARPRCAYV